MGKKYARLAPRVEVQCHFAAEDFQRPVGRIVEHERPAAARMRNVGTKADTLP